MIAGNESAAEQGILDRKAKQNRTARCYDALMRLMRLHFAEQAVACARAATESRDKGLDRLGQTQSALGRGVECRMKSGRVGSDWKGFE